MTLAEELTQEWRLRLQTDCSDLPSAAQDSILKWLFGDNPNRFDELSPEQVAVTKQAMDYRYRILQQRYLRVNPNQAHRQLMQRLGSLFLIRSKIRTWVAQSRDRHRTVLDVLQEVIQELIQSDSYMRQQMTWISQCTDNSRLRNSITLASIEEYCLRPIRNQPLLVYRFVNYLRRSQRGGMTQVPANDLIRLVSEEITPDESDGPISLLDTQAVAQYQASQDWEEQQVLRATVLQEFSAYLENTVDATAAQWLQLHVQGKSQDEIAKTLGLTINQVYRLREKIRYHSINFALKAQPELVTGWLGTSMEHNLGLALAQWEAFLESLVSLQRQILEGLKAGKSVETIAQELDMKPNQVMGEWIKIYTAAQEFRNDKL